MSGYDWFPERAAASAPKSMPYQPASMSPQELEAWVEWAEREWEQRLEAAERGLEGPVGYGPAAWALE